MEETIDLRQYFAIIKKRFWIIALITLVSATVSAGVSFFVLSPVYEAKTTLIVKTDKASEGSTTVTGDQLNVTQKLAITYGEIIKSRIVLENVIEELNLEETYEELTGKISISPVKDTQIISISVQDTNPTKAKDIANVIPGIFTDEAKRIADANSVEVIDKAVEPQNAIKPNKVMNVLIAAILGLMIGLFVIFLIEYMDTKMRTPEDVERHLGLPLLGVVPNENTIK